MLNGQPHGTSGGRWLDDDIVDELLTLVINGGRGERFGDGVFGSYRAGELVVSVRARAAAAHGPAATGVPRWLTETTE